MAEPVVLHPLAKGGIARMLPASLGEALREHDEGMQIGHAENRSARSAAWKQFVTAERLLASCKQTGRRLILYNSGMGAKQVDRRDNGHTAKSYDAVNTLTCTR